MSLNRIHSVEIFHEEQGANEISKIFHAGASTSPVTKKDAARARTRKYVFKGGLKTASAAVTMTTTTTTTLVFLFPSGDLLLITEWFLHSASWLFTLGRAVRRVTRERQTLSCFFFGPDLRRDVG